MGPKAMNEFRERASEIMIRSVVTSQMMVESAGSLKRVYSADRTSFGQFFSEKFPLLDHFQKRVEMFTGFSLSNPFEQNEELQAVSYTSLGSHVSVHDDRVRQNIILRSLVGESISYSSLCVIFVQLQKQNSVYMLRMVSNFY